MASKDKKDGPHEFSKVPGFTDALKQIASVPKEVVDERDAEWRRQREQDREAAKERN